MAVSTDPGERVVIVAMPQQAEDRSGQQGEDLAASGRSASFVPFGPVQLDAGVWLARSEAEQKVEWARCHEEMQGFIRAGVRSMKQMPAQGRALYGVWEAARWSLGRTAAAPVWHGDRRLSGASIRSEIALAMNVASARAEEWEQAIGAYVWLRWLIGDEDQITYPLW